MPRGFIVPHLEILLGLGKLLDKFGGVLERDELSTAGQGIGSSKARDQSATMQPRRADVGSAGLGVSAVEIIYNRWDSRALQSVERIASLS